VDSGNPGWPEIKWYKTGLVYADGVNVLGGSVHIVKEDAETLVANDRGIGSEC
jgi:hypothetical protein